MRNVVQHIEDLAPAPSIITIGGFDGVHRGHQHLISRARDAANAQECQLIALTFDPLPIEVFRPDAFPGRLVTNQRRRALLWQFGADSIVELQFDRDMAQLTAREFMDRLAVVGPILEIWVGDDFALGHNREGTPDQLQALTSEQGTIVHAIPRVAVNGADVSSSRIRSRISVGAARDASTLLGHRFRTAGEVVKGAQLGREMGFPTANVAPPQGLIELSDGIYATYARVGGEEAWLPAMTYIGKRPSVNTGARMIETHLFDFDADLYGKQLTTEFVEHTREDIEFPSLEQLIEQLGEDEKTVRDILASTKPNSAPDAMMG